MRILLPARLVAVIALIGLLASLEACTVILDPDPGAVRPGAYAFDLPYAG